MDKLESVVREHLTEECELDSERKQLILGACGVGTDDLSKNGQLHLAVLSDLASVLEIKDVRTSSYLMALNDLEENIRSLESSSSVLNDNLTRTQRSLDDLEADERLLQTVSKQLDDAQMAREMHESTAMMERRCADFEMRIQEWNVKQASFEATLGDAGFDDSARRFEHDQIVDLAQEIQDLNLTNQRLRADLSQFHELPLSKEGVAQMIQDARKELQDLEEHFHSEIKKMV